MKCLSLMQPYATLVVIGAKRFETRDWRTDYTGPLAIHASRRFTESARSLCRQEPFRSVLARAGYRHSADLPTGVIIGRVQLVECVTTAAARFLLRDAPDELAFGDFHKARWAWHLAEPREFRERPCCRGRLGLFEMELQTEMF